MSEQSDHNCATDKSAKAGQSAEQGNDSHTGKTTKDTGTETMRFMLDLPPMQTRQKAEHAKAYSVRSKIPTTHSMNPSKTQWDANPDGASLG